MIKVIKRDGRIKDFNMDRIKLAIKSAYLDVYGSDKDYLKDNLVIEAMIKHKVDNMGVEILDIDDIQNIVRVSIRDINCVVGDAYCDYMEKRRKVRDSKSDTYRKLDTVLQCSDVLNSNANVDEHSFGGRKFESANVVLKRYTLDKVIPEDIVKAHLENRAYIHDLDSYAVGMHNCSYPDIKTLLDNGFTTRNGDVRGARSLSTAFQQIAVIFQIQSQEQFGGTGSCHIDYDLESQVNISFRKHFADGLLYVRGKETDYRDLHESINIENISMLRKDFSDIMFYAERELEKEGLQSAQGLYHNLNTLESRPGSQVPFTSINYGRRTTEASRLISKWLLQASLDGIGKNHKTSIFPISIFQHKKGINDVDGSPNYDLKKLAIKSMSKRIYPNWVNCDWSRNIEDENNPDTSMATMG